MRQAELRRDGNCMSVVRGGAAVVSASDGIVNVKEARNGFTKNPSLCFLTSPRSGAAAPSPIAERAKLPIGKCSYVGGVLYYLKFFNNCRG